MIDVTPLFLLYAKWRYRHLQRMNPGRSQRKQLQWLTSRAASTKFGKAHEFESIKSVNDYQQRVPLRTYEHFWADYWQHKFPTLDNCTWPGRIPYFANSSGTTSGQAKFLPVTVDMINSNLKATTDLLAYHLINRPSSKVLGGKICLLGASTDLGTLSKGVKVGWISGITTSRLPWWLKPRYFPSPELASIPDWEERMDCIAKASLNEDLRMISGMPTWMNSFFAKSILASKGTKHNLAELYPNLELLVHGGVNFAPYQIHYRDLLDGSRADLREVYPASEGFIAIADRRYGEGLRMNLDHGLFYEFVPVEELGSVQPTRHWIGNVEPDINYAIVLTTCAGLWSYLVGDTVRFVDTKIPRILVTGRTSYFLNSFGEHLIGEELESCIACAAQKIHSPVADFTVGPVFPTSPGEPGFHLYVVEFFSGLQHSQALQDFTESLDCCLRSKNLHYSAFRSSAHGISLPKVVVVPKGSFLAWMKRRGKLGDQNKVPRIVTDLSILTELINLSKVI
jgi:hypothetical protein